jgi:hypothetical protein
MGTTRVVVYEIYAPDGAKVGEETVLQAALDRKRALGKGATIKTVAK